MKRTILISFFLVLSSFKLFAQTKEETIKWLTEKINQYGKDSWFLSLDNINTITNNPTRMAGAMLGTSVLVDAGKIIITQHWYNDNGGEMCSYSYSVGFDDITESVSERYYTDRSIIGMNLQTNGYKIRFVKYTPGPYANEKAEDKDLEKDRNAMDFYINFYAEPNLDLRMAKAIQKLISFKPKEAF